MTGGRAGSPQERCLYSSEFMNININWQTNTVPGLSEWLCFGSSVSLLTLASESRTKHFHFPASCLRNKQIMGKADPQNNRCCFFTWGKKRRFMKEVPKLLQCITYIWNSDLAFSLALSEKAQLLNQAQDAINSRCSPWDSWGSDLSS